MYERWPIIFNVSLRSDFSRVLLLALTFGFFSASALTSFAAPPPAPPLLNYTIAAGSISGSTKIDITDALGGGNAFKYKKQSGAFTTPAVASATADLGLVNYTSGADIPGVVAGQHIGLFEVDGTGGVVKFVDITVAAGEIAAEIFDDAGISAGSAPGTSKISTVTGAGNSLRYEQRAAADPAFTIPAWGSATAVPPLVAYSSGSNIAVVNGDRIGLYEVTGAGNVVRFEVFTINLAVIAPPVVTATLAPGTSVGSTKITATAGAGNRLGIKKQVGAFSNPGTNVAITRLGLLDDNYESGDTITGAVAGQHIGLYEINGAGIAGRVVGFTDITLLAAHIKTGLTYSASSLTEKFENDGEISATITITANNETFSAGVRNSNLAARVTGTPAGLTPVLSVNAGGTAATLSFTGSATANSIDNNTSVSVTFLNADFTGASAAAVLNAVGKVVTINFRDPYAIITGTTGATGGAGDYSISIPENSTIVTTVQGNTFADAPRWSITGAADPGRFDIDPITGDLSFKVAPNFEAPADADLDNLYVVEVSLNDFATGGNGGTGALTSQNLFITVTDVAESADATLAALITNAGALTPIFAAGTTAYLAAVANGTTAATVTPTRNEAHATIEAQVNGGGYSAVTSGAESGNLSLNVGNNTVDVRVTAEDGATRRTYTITVTRAAAPAAPAPPVKTAAELEVEKKAAEAAEKKAAEELVKRETEEKARAVVAQRALEAQRVQFQAELKVSAAKGIDATRKLLAPTVKALKNLNAATKLLDDLIKSSKKKVVKKPKKVR